MKKNNAKKNMKTCYKCGVSSPFLVENEGYFYCKKCYNQKRLMKELYFQMMDMNFAEKTIKKLLGVENNEIIK